MNKITVPLFFSSLLFINIFADNEIKTDLPNQTLSSQELNSLDEDGYSPLHRLAQTDNNVPLFIQAVKNAHRGWTYAYGDSFCGYAGEDARVTWKANLYTREEVIAMIIANAKATTDAIVEVIKELIKAGAIVDFPDRYGRTALWWAAEYNQPAIITCLIEAGANINGNDGAIPLSNAAYNGDKEAVEALLVHGANPNMQVDGDTPLHDAACGADWLYPSNDPMFKKCHPERLQDYKDVIYLLMKYGASNSIKNDEGKTPSQVARDQQREFYPERTEFTLAEYIEALSSST